MDFNGMFYISAIPAHTYCLYSEGTKMRTMYFTSRNDAKRAMYKYCNKHGIQIECTENDKHEKKYSNHNGVRFFINRIN